MADVPVGLAITTAAEMVESLMTGHRLTHVVMACDDGLVARADPERLRQILLNLLSNASKFTPAGGTITTECVATDTEVCIRASDTGIGIPVAEHELIFEPFVQVDSRLTRTQEGVGLGLAISRDLARGMGGDLTAESALGKGSTFTLSLPLPRDMT